MILGSCSRDSFFGELEEDLVLWYLMTPIPLRVPCSSEARDAVFGGVVLENVLGSDHTLDARSTCTSAYIRRRERRPKIDKSNVTRKGCVSLHANPRLRDAVVTRSRWSPRRPRASISRDSMTRIWEERILPLKLR